MTETRRFRGAIFDASTACSEEAPADLLATADLVLEGPEGVPEFLRRPAA